MEGGNDGDGESGEGEGKNGGGNSGVELLDKVRLQLHQVVAELNLSAGKGKSRRTSRRDIRMPIAINITVYDFNTNIVLKYKSCIW